MTSEIAAVAVGRKFRADKLGHGVVVGRGYHVTHVVWLDSDGVPHVLESVPDCMRVKPGGVSRHVTLPIAHQYDGLFEARGI